MTRINNTYNGDHSPMTNAQRAYIGRHLLSQYRILCSEPEVSEETARDAVCDILHAAVADRHFRVAELNRFCASCVNHVEEELAEELDAAAL